MLRYNKYKRFFLAPDAGGGSGGGGSTTVGNPAAGQAGGQTQEDDPFAKLQMDDLDPEARKIVEAAKAKLASLQTSAKQAEEAAALSKKNEGLYQGRFDALKAEFDKRVGTTVSGTPEEQAKAAKFAEIQGILTKRGVPPDQAKVQAETMLEMLDVQAREIRSEIGRDLAPFAGKVVSQVAEQAWGQAEQLDKIGALQIPKVREETWQQVQKAVGMGQEVTPELVKNLAAMSYLRHLEAGGTPGQQQQQQMAPPLPNMGGPPSYGGYAQQQRAPDPNAPKYILDPATDAALQVVFGKWGADGIKAPGYRGTVTKKG